MPYTWQHFHQVQAKAAHMLANSMTKDRVAHAYIFEGIRGTGKKEAGILFAKSIFCERIEKGYIPCESCNNCKRITSGNHPDVHIVQPEGLSIKKGQIHALQGEFSKTGLESNKKLYMIVDADKMTTNAANSLLKFLEEPHAGTIAILTTEQIQKIIPTIISRCQVLSFQPLQPALLIQALMDKGILKEKARVVSQLTNNLDKALDLCNDEWFAQAQKLVLKLYEAIGKNPLGAMVLLQEQWFGHFKEKEQLDRGLDLLLLIFKDLIYIQLGNDEQLLYLQMQDVLRKDALRQTSKSVANKMSSILEAKRKLSSNMNSLLLMEQLVLNLQEGSSFV